MRKRSSILAILAAGAALIFSAGTASADLTYAPAVNPSTGKHCGNGIVMGQPTEICNYVYTISALGVDSVSRDQSIVARNADVQAQYAQIPSSSNDHVPAGGSSHGNCNQYLMSGSASDTKWSEVNNQWESRQTTRYSVQCWWYV